MTQSRRFTRVRPGGKVSGAGKIIVAPREPTIDCTIIDYSAGGACLDVFGAGSLPGRFELVWGTTRKKCRVVWRTRRRAGVVF